MNLTRYRELLRGRRTRRVLTGLGVSALGDGMSTVTIAWLAVRVAPGGRLGVFVGLAVAAYTLPGVIGALTLVRVLRRRPARTLVLLHCLLRTAFLGMVAALWGTGALSPPLYVLLLAGSSLLSAWGNAGQYAMLSELGGADGRLAINSLATAQVSFAVIAGPLVAGLLIGRVGPGWLIALDGASFAFLGIQAWRTPASGTATEQPVDTQTAESGLRLLLRRRDLLSLTLLTWLFFFLYGPVEAALPVYVAGDLHADAGLLGAYWTAFGVGALAATLLTGTLRARDVRRAALLIVAGWGACLLPFAFAPVGVTLACFALGGLVYGPYLPITYAQYQSATTPANLPAVLAARSAIILVSTPLGTAIGGPLVGALGATGTLAASGGLTVALAVAARLLWAGEDVRPMSQGPDMLPRHAGPTTCRRRAGRSGRRRPPPRRARARSPARGRSRPGPGGPRPDR
jgi:predicted MFS family arabinose efflux permease